MPSRPICSRSTPRSKRRAPARRDGLRGGRHRSKTLATQTGKATGEIGAKIAEIQSTTSQAVASIGAIAEAIDELSLVTNSVAAAMDQQRAATQGFVTNVRGTTTAVSDVAARMTGIADMVTRSSSNAAEVARVAADMQRRIRERARRNPRNRARRAARGFARSSALRRRPDGVHRVRRSKTSARVFDVSRGGARIAAVPHVAMDADAVVTFGGMRPLKGKVAWIAGDCLRGAVRAGDARGGRIAQARGLDRAA